MVFLFIASFFIRIVEERGLEVKKNNSKAKLK